MGIVPIVSLVLDMSGIDRDASGSLLRRLVDVLVRHVLRLPLLGEHLRNSGSQGGLAVIDVADGPNVDVGFVSHISAEMQKVLAQLAEPGGLACKMAGKHGYIYQVSMECLILFLY